MAAVCYGPNFLLKYLINVIWRATYQPQIVRFLELRNQAALKAVDKPGAVFS